MKKFKKIFFAIAILLAGVFALTACTKVDLAEAKDALKITYAQGDSVAAVKSNLQLPKELEEFKGVTVSWVSDKPTVIANDGKVVRQDYDTVVTLTATLRLEGKDPVTASFKVTVLAKESDTPNITFVVTAPEGTEKVYIVGSFNEWKEKEAIELTKGTDGKFKITMPLATGEHKYKYVRTKSWEFVEKNADFSELADNRVITVGKKAITQQDTVAAWAKYYTVTFNLNGGVAAGGSDPISIGHNGQLKAADLLEVTKEHHQFDGWYTDQALTTKAVLPMTVTANVNLYAKWTPKHLVTFVLNGGTSTSTELTKRILHGTELKASDLIAEPTKEHNRFDGWFTDEDLTAKAVFPLAINAETKLYAKWTPKHLVTFVLNGGTSTSESLTLRIFHGEQLTEDDLIAEPTKENHKFEGWFTDEELNTALVLPLTINGETKLYAEWTKKHLVTFVLNGGTSTSEGLTLRILNNGKLTTNDLINEPTKADHNFVGWFTDQALTTAAVLPLTITADTNLYAKWESRLQLQTLLNAKYEETLAVLNFLVETDTVTLVNKIGDFDVTWFSSNPTVLNASTGAVTRPAFTDGELIYVILMASAEGQDDVTYIVTVNQLPETLEQKLDKELARLVNFPSSYKPILKQDLGLDALKDVKVDGEKVTEATWTSEFPDYITHEGKLTDLEFEGDKDVKITVTFTYEGITKTESVTFTVRGVLVYDNFLDAINGPKKASKSEMVKIKGVSYYVDTNDGYYMVDSQGNLLFVFGKSSKPATDKRFDVKFEYDLYYSSPQAKNPKYTVIEGEAFTNVPITEITIEDLAELEVPSDNAPLVHKLYKVTGAKIHTYNKDNNYKTFLVPQTHADPTKEPNKSDSLMLYYQTPGGLNTLKQFAPISQKYSIDLDHIVIIVSAFRTNNDIFAFMFLGDVTKEADLKFGVATPEQAAEQALMKAAAKIQDQLFVAEHKFNLSATEQFEEETYNITYASQNAANVNDAGEIVLFPEPGTFVDVTFKLSTTTVETTPQTVELLYKVKIGRPELSKIDEIVTVREGTVVAFEGYLVDDYSNTYTFVNPDSNRGVAVRYAKNVEKGKWYIIVAERAADYNNLVQFNFVGLVASEKTEPAVPKAYTGALTAAALASYQSGWISIAGLEVVAVPTGDTTVTYKLKNANGETISFREQKADYYNPVKALDLAVGYFVDVKSVVVSWYKDDPQFIFGVLEKLPLTEQQLFDLKVVAFKNTLPEDNTVYYEDFTLPVTHDDLAIAWSITEGDAATVAADGKVTLSRKAEEATVKLTGKVTKSDFEGSVVLTIKVAKEGEVAPVSLKYTIDFGTVAKLGYAGDSVTFTNGDGTEITMAKLRAQVATSTFAPHDTAGAFAVVSSIKDNTLSWIQFEITRDLAQFTFDIASWNQNYYDQTVALTDSTFKLEKLVDGAWVAVADIENNTNVFSSLTKNVYTTITYEDLVSGTYRIVYETPSATKDSNTAYAICIDNMKFYW
ncbi:MAG: InlB B-repeat-containing protein [Acholeplasmataceae bacterium]|jgi:uncharacterized repeat protein (TIGR02543 family)